MTLRTKASLLISLIIIIVMGTSGLYYLHFLQQSLKDSILAGVEVVSDTTSRAISDFLADSLKETQAVALALPVEALEKKDAPVIRDRLKTLLAIFPKFENGMFILDKDGRMWVDYPQNPGAMGTVLSYREYFQKTIKEEEGVIGVPYVSVRTGKPVLTFTALLRGSANQVVGVLGCSVQMLSPDALGGIRQIKIGRSGYIYVFDTSRTMLLHPENERVLKQDIPPGANKLLDAALEGFEGVGETVNSRGVPMLTAFKRIPGTNWIIGAQQLREEAFLPIARARQGLILSIIIMVVVAVIAVAIAIRRITRPLTKLRQAVMFWGKEESAESQRVAKELEKIRGTDEIGELANAFLDISKHLEATIAEFLKEKQLSETLIDSLPGVFYVVTDQGRFLRWNANFEQVTGYNAAEFAELTPLDLFAGEDKNLIAQAIQEVFLTGVATAEAELVAKEGSRIPYFFTGRRLDLDGAPCLIGMGMDITARQQAEEALRSTRDYLENIFANSADGIGIVDRDGKFTRWNKAAEEIYGYTFEELKGRSAFDLYADSGELDVMLKQLRQHGFIRNYEINMKKNDGSVFTASLSTKVLRNSDNEVIGSITVIRDLTETRQMMMHLQNEIYQHEQARQALLESEQKLINIIDFLPDATFVIDTKGKVIAWNKAIEEMTGFKAQDMEGKGNYEYALPIYGERRPILIDLVLEPQKGINKYADVKRKAGALMAVAHITNFKGKETYLFAKASALIDSHGDIIGSIETIRDITALRKAETDRLQFSKLESMSILAGGIAHDFNNILTAILGNISLAVMDGKIEPQVRDRLSRAEQACLRAQGLSQQLLTFAKGGAPIKKIVSMANLLKESAILTLSGSKSRYEMSITDDLWSVEADAGQINQVINNLMINADQAMPEGGIIQISAENCLVAAESNLPISQGKYVKFIIADQGTGISPKYLDKIFDPYFSTKQKGSGLGLATAYSIINNHSGHLQVESQLGIGTTFYIYLPAVVLDQGVPAEEPETVELTMGQGKVLVMDDEEIVREVIGRMLSRLGYEPDFAGDGSQAMEKYIKAMETKRPFDAVILDLTISGGMGGKETIEKLFMIDPQIKAIVSSGYSDDPIMADFRKYGFSEVIAKPYRISELSKILQRVILKKGD